jgi:hypothetical protein
MLFGGGWNSNTYTDYNRVDIFVGVAAVVETPASITGVVTLGDADDGTSDGNLTLTQDMSVTATGDLTLNVAEVGNLAGGKIITVQPGGKIKLTSGRQATVLAGSLYKLLT